MSRDPAYWYRRAEEARAKAEVRRDPHGRQAMLTAAESYAALAALAERRAEVSAPA